MEKTRNKMNDFLKMFIVTVYCSLVIVSKLPLHAFGIKPLVDAPEVIVLNAQLGGMFLVVGSPNGSGKVAQINVFTITGNGSLDERVDTGIVFGGIDGVKIPCCANHKLSTLIDINNIFYKLGHY